VKINRLYPLKFQPIPQKRIWGGNRLRTHLNKPFDEENIGESWEISGVSGSVSVIENGLFKGKNLQDIIEKSPKELLGENVINKYGHTFPLLIKFIDAQQDLSIQLHPNDTLARQRHNSMGKEEMWYIVDSKPESCLMFGFNQEVDKEKYKQHLSNNTLPDILHYQQVKSGEVYHIPTGRVHAIGKDILLAEIQQSSDVTYRLYDWDRTDAEGNPRELHTELALDAIDFSHLKNFETKYLKESNTRNKTVESDYFTTNYFTLNKAFEVEKPPTHFTIFVCVGGAGKLSVNDSETSILLGEVLLIPAAIEHFVVIPHGTIQLLEVIPV
jgi:mannose-6-phosphate isomerase